MRYQAKHESPFKYFTMMLNMAEDDLDPFEYRLLAHFVRWAGQGGNQQESARQMADACMMSVNKTRQTLRALKEKGYIDFVIPDEKQRRQRVPTMVMVKDRWEENIKRYSKKPVSENTHSETSVSDMTHSQEASVSDMTHLNGASVSNMTQLEEHTKELTTKNTLDATRPNDPPPSIEECASAILVATPVAPAPQPPNSAVPPSPQAGQGEAPTIPAIIKAWLDALPAQPVENVPPYKNKHYRRIAQGLIDAGYTPANVTAYVKAQLAEDWREVKYVRFAEVGEKLPFWKPKKAAPQFSHPSHKPFDYEAAESSVDGPIHPDVDKALEEHLERLRKSA